MVDRHRNGGAPWHKHTRRSNFPGMDLDGHTLMELRRRIRRERPEDEDEEPPAGDMDAGGMRQ